MRPMSCSVLHPLVCVLPYAGAKGLLVGLSDVEQHIGAVKQVSAVNLVQAVVEGLTGEGGSFVDCITARSIGCG